MKNAIYISKNRFSSLPIMVLIGLGVAQVIGTFQVAWSNMVLYHRLEAIRDSGYQTVPDVSIEPGLLSFQAALGGGLFFTLTVGAFLSLFTIGWLKLFHGPLNRPKWGVVTLTVLVAGGLVLCNWNGFNLFGSLYLLFIPLLLCLVDKKWGARPKKDGYFIHMLLLFGPIIILALLGLSRFDRDVFSDVRDQLLLSNSPGRAVNDFYYRYSLYPAESFKSLAQKQIRTVYLDDTFRPSLRSSLADTLAARDYLPVLTEDQANMVFRPGADEHLIIESRIRTERMPADSFLKTPDLSLLQLTRTFDSYWGLRKIILISLLCGFPLLVYLSVFGAIRMVLTQVVPRRVAMIGTSMTCLILGVIIIWPLNAAKMMKPSQPLMVDLVGSSDPQKRLTGLKLLEQQGGDLSSYPIYPSILHSRHVAIRYRLARILAHGRGEPTYRDLLEMLNDPSPNVVCMALRSLGIRLKRQAIPIILNKLQQSNHWYVQWYAYNALKKLKWRQYALN